MMKQPSASSDVHGAGKLRACRVITKRRAPVSAPPVFDGMTDGDALSRARLASIAPHKPVGAIAYSENGKASTNQWTGNWADAPAFIVTRRVVAIAIAIAGAGRH